MKDIRITDRQERIEGFRQKVIDEAAVCVIGTGRTGNEVLKNMALAGFRRVLIADMDTVAKTNLPATVLFTKNDLGRLKVDAAAEAYRRLSIADSCAVDRINADVCTGLGEGAVRRCDLIINCVDNDQTRLYTAHLGKLLGIPCIDVGIRDLDWTIFAASGDKDEACYGCTMTQGAWDKALERVRNSCDVTLRDNIAQGKAST
ncbi:MAG: ThiF family adenylyltransferase, partial [Firmicutes bacterium]|nr:ThiF family adenylyltransferase [Bacillota bacterium]